MKKQAIKQVIDNSELETALETLRRSIARWTDKSERVETAIPGLILYQRATPTQPASAMYEPSVCVVAQGAKRVLLGDDAYVYDHQHFLITSVDLPTVVQIIKASRGMAIGEVTLSLLTSIQRLVDLLSEPKDIPILAPIIQREISYRLLVSDQGARLRQMASAGSQSQQIARAIDWLKVNFMRPMRIDDLAAQVNMSTSTFHHHFRQVTAMSPLQYQKWLRLNEARRLMLAESQDATTAAFQVGYESPSQFSREYSRLFGAPPLRDITSLRLMAAPDGG